MIHCTFTMMCGCCKLPLLNSLGQTIRGYSPQDLQHQASEQGWDCELELCPACAVKVFDHTRPYVVQYREEGRHVWIFASRHAKVDAARNSLVQYIRNLRMEEVRLVDWPRQKVLVFMGVERRVNDDDDY